MKTRRVSSFGERPFKVTLGARPQTTGGTICVANASRLADGDAMTILARVHNRMITLPPDIAITEGTEVSVTLPDPAPMKSAISKALPWLRRARGTATSGLKTDDILKMTRSED